MTNFDPLKKGKAYAHRHSVDERPEGDFYVTPRSLMWVARTWFEQFLDKELIVLDPCCGSHVMADALRPMGYEVRENDLYDGGVDYLCKDWMETQVVMNPPFSQWDAFVMKAKSHADVIFCIGRLNYLSTQSRYESTIWGGLQFVLPFTRYVDYRTPLRDDGRYQCGAMATGWFIWRKDYKGSPNLKMLDVQQYAGVIS